jgi:hypothetical protein
MQTDIFVNFKGPMLQHMCQIDGLDSEDVHQKIEKAYGPERNWSNKFWTVGELGLDEYVGKKLYLSVNDEDSMNPRKLAVSLYDKEYIVNADFCDTFGLTTSDKDTMEVLSKNTKIMENSDLYKKDTVEAERVQKELAKLGF